MKTYLFVILGVLFAIATALNLLTILQLQKAKEKLRQKEVWFNSRVQQEQKTNWWDAFSIASNAEVTAEIERQARTIQYLRGVCAEQKQAGDRLLAELAAERQARQNAEARLLANAARERNLRSLENQSNRQFRQYLREAEQELWRTQQGWQNRLR